MNSRKSIVVYTDYKSPYAYLAKDLVYELERDFPVTVDWLPYTLDIPSFLGSARVDERGTVIEANRDPHQWRRVRYSYMDCRRQGRKRGLTDSWPAQDLGFVGGRDWNAMGEAPGPRGLSQLSRPHL